MRWAAATFHVPATLAAILGLLSACTATYAQNRQHDGGQQFAELGDLKLRSGDVIRELRLGYRTLGKLNRDKSNAILWPTYVGGRSEDLMQFIGPGKVVDSRKYFVVLVDAIGNGSSTSPSNSKLQPRMKFPEFSIRDMVESEHQLLTDVLHLSHVHAVMGISMGGMQTFEWTLAYPDFMDLAVPMAGSPQSTSYDKLFWTTEIDALESDPNWKKGNGNGPMTQGFELYNEINSMNASSPAHRVTSTSSGEFGAFLARTRQAEIGDAAAACDGIRQRQAMISLDIPEEYSVTLAQAAKRVHARLLVVVTPQDHMVNPRPALVFAAAIDAPVLTLDSECGHLSFACISIGPTVAQFLSNPASVSSKILH